MPVSKSEKLNFRRKFMRQVRKANSLQDDITKQIIALSEEMRKEVQALLLEYGKVARDTPLTIQQVNAIRDQVPVIMNNYIAKAQTVLDSGINSIAGQAISGLDDVKDILQVAASPLIGIDPVILSTASGFSADLVKTFSGNLMKDVAADTLKKINTELSLSFLGQKDAFSTMRGIDDALGTAKKTGVTAKAERIARTEFGRVYNGAAQGGLEQIGKNMSQDEREFLDKEWISALTPTTRDDHADSHGQIVQYDKPFSVGGEELMFPGDPAGTPGNTINCLCTMVINTDRLLDYRSEQLERGIAPR